MGLESKEVTIGDRKYQIAALGSKAATDLLPLATRVAGPVIVSLFAVQASVGESGDTSNAALARALATEGARMLQGAAEYPDLAAAAMRACRYEAPAAPGRWIELDAQERVDDSFFSRRQFEKARVVFEFVQWNYADFFDGMQQLAGKETATPPIPAAPAK